MQGFIVGEDWMGGTLSFPDIGFGPISTEYFVISPDGANGGNKFAEGIVFGVEFISNLKVFWNGRSRLTVNEMMSVRCITN